MPIRSWTVNKKNEGKNNFFCLEQIYYFLNENKVIISLSNHQKNILNILARKINFWNYSKIRMYVARTRALDHVSSLLDREEREPLSFFFLIIQKTRNYWETDIEKEYGLWFI